MENINIYALFTTIVCGTLGFGMLIIEIVHFYKYGKFIGGCTYTPPKNVLPPPFSRKTK